MAFSLTDAGPIITGILAAGGAYFVATRTKSGRINTTEADVLWEEGQAIRGELRAEVKGLRAEIVARDQRIWKLELELAEERRERRLAETELASLKEGIKTIERQLQNKADK